MTPKEFLKKNSPEFSEHIENNLLEYEENMIYISMEQYALSRLIEDSNRRLAELSGVNND